MILTTGAQGATKKTTQAPLQGPGYGYYGPADVYKAPTGPKAPSGNPVVYNPNSQSQVLGVGVTGGSSGGSQAPQNNQINDQLNAGNDQIERDYQNYLGALSSQETNLRNEAPLAEQRTEANYAPVKSDIQNQGKQKIAGLESQATTVNTQKTSQLQQARDLYRQLNQQNIAQLSGLGISSSSVAEALAENLGVETARRIASVSQSADDVIRGIEKEKTNVNDYVNTKLTEVDRTIALEKQGIQEKLRQGLDQINQARQLAASDKANRRQDLLTQAQSAMAQLQANAQNFAQTLQMWKAQTTAGLDTAANKDWGSIFSGYIEAAPQMGAFANTLDKYGLAPSYDFGTNGSVKVSVGTKKTEKTDPYTEYLNQIGATQAGQ